MSEPMLIFETDSERGTPKLKPLNGTASLWTAKDLCQLEDLLRPRYEALVRNGEGTIEFKGRLLHVKKKIGDTSRQPTLELRPAEQVPRPLEKAYSLPKPPPAIDWAKGFLAEIDRLFGSDRINSVLPAERAMLRVVREELLSVFEKKPSSESALLVLVSILMTAEYLSRSQRPGEPQPYAFALSGIERLLNETMAPPQTPWGRLPAKPNAEPPPTWVGRLWSRLAGT